MYESLAQQFCRRRDHSLDNHATSKLYPHSFICIRHVLVVDGGNDLTTDLQHHKEQQQENALAAAMQSQQFTVSICVFPV